MIAFVVSHASQRGSESADAGPLGPADPVGGRPDPPGPTMPAGSAQKVAVA